MSLSPLLLLLLRLLLFMIGVHSDVHSDALRCIFASTQQTALERWIHCLPSLQPPLTTPSQDRFLDDPLALPPPLTANLTSLPCTTSSPLTSNVCDPQTLRDALLGVRETGWDRPHAAWCPYMATDGSSHAIGDANSPMNESSQVIQAIDESSVSPDANLDCVDLVGAGEATGENQLDEWSQCENRGIATDGLASRDLGNQFQDNLEVGSRFLKVQDAAVVGDAPRIVAADKGIAANLPDDSSDVSFKHAKIEAIYDESTMDCEVESIGKGVQGDAFPAALRLNVVSALLLTLITACWRKINRNESRRRRRSSNRLQGNLGTARDLPKTTRRPAADIDNPKTLVENLRPGILGAPLGTAVGAVFAEVFLNKSCSCRTAVSANEIGTLLEIAMRESLTPIVGVGSLVDDFMASFQSTYKTICTVHQACSRNSTDCCQNIAEMAGVDPTCEREMPADARKSFNKTDENFDPLNTKFSQQMNCAGETDARKDDLQDLCKDVHDLRQGDSHSRSCNSLQKNANKSSRLRFRYNREFQSGFCSVMDVSEKTGKNISLADCSQSWFSERSNSSIERGECSTIESAIADDCTLLWNCMLPASRGNPMTEQSMMLPGEGSSKSTPNEDHSCSHPFPRAQQTGYYQDVYTELPDKVQDSVTLHDHDGEVGHWARNISLSSAAELSSEDKDTAILDSQCDDEDTIIQEHSGTSQPAGGLLNAVVPASQTHRLPEAGWQRAFLNVFEKSVQAQEQHNYFKSLELAHLLRQHTLGEKQLQLASLSNDLMKEHIDLSRSKASFKKSTVLEQRLNAAHVEFSRACADELVAGLFVMLLSLAYSVRRYSSAILFDLVSTCQIAAKEPHRSSWLYIDWFYNSLDSLTGQLKAFVCHVTVAGRILFGSTIVAVVSYLLLRQSVTRSSQSMSAVIIIIVLGVICGLAGKVSVDSLGGNGLYWLFMWEMLCAIHALANCFTPFIYKLVNGSPSCKETKFQIPLWPRRLVFHFTIVLLLPILAGQLPFDSISNVSQDLLSVLNGTVSSILLSCWHSMGHVS